MFVIMLTASVAFLIGVIFGRKETLRQQQAITDAQKILLGEDKK